MSAHLSLATLNRTIHFGVILTNGITELLDVAPVDLFNGLTKEFLKDVPDEMFPAHFKDQGLDITFHWVSEHGSAVPAKLSSGLTITPTDSFESCPPLDIVLIGANNPLYQPNEAELAYARKSYESCLGFITICGGFQVALSAGILNGKTATAPRMLLEDLKQKAPQVKWVEKRWVRDDKLWTSGTLLNGTDLMTNFIRQTWDVKEDSFIEFMLRACSSVDRDVDYKDVTWAL
ncbi:hypothetical protein VHEMI09391 [[Torrubiella] hemipterigena]|uniref:DJ-1/PfpI domain-containing protein n=1 Tax=[Torrubiella] hemipterigena TaxID=1531966 RepID=A0A0A1TG92_9HYPO|nr:hypothetical protein VHEMI09391 [[Torrubiella] hemipterigena]